jgi:hypothetical protein
MQYSNKGKIDRKEAIRRRREIVMRNEELEEEHEASRKKQVHAKLEISQAGDAHEQQADAVAQKVTAGKDASSILTQQLSFVPSAQTKSEGESLQAPGNFQSQLDSSKGSGQSLPENVQKDIGGKMGADLSDVKIHTGSNAHEMSEGINAKAFTHGQDIYFKNGNYNPESSDGKNLLAHELTHTVQQGSGKVQPKIQRFESNEHKKMGDMGSGNSSVKLSDQLSVSYGDMTALAGDFFGTVKDIKDIAKIQGSVYERLTIEDYIKEIEAFYERWKGYPKVEHGMLIQPLPYLFWHKGTVDEILYAIIVEIRGLKKYKKAFDPKIADAVDFRGNTLLTFNWNHFTNSSSDKTQSKDKEGHPMTNAVSYREAHEQAIKAAVQAGNSGKSIDDALVYESFASHFLTDAYSAGHTRVERFDIAKYWDGKIPMFWTNIKWWITEQMSKGLDTMMKPGQLVFETAKSIIFDKMDSKKVPPMTFGDVVGGALHDYDNLHGVHVKNKYGLKFQKDVELLGDGQIIRKENEEGGIKAAAKIAMSAERENASATTLKLVVNAVKVSLNDVKAAYNKGKQQVKDTKKVIESLQTKNKIYKAEQLWPEAVSDSDLNKENQKLQWKADDFEALVLLPHVKEALIAFFTEKSKAIETSMPLTDPDQKKAMENNVIKNLQGSNTIKSLREIVNYYPGIVMSLGGIGGVYKGGITVDNFGIRTHTDVAIDYYKEVKASKKGLASLTFMQRFSLIHTNLSSDGSARQKEMINSLFISTPQQDWKKLIDGDLLKWKDLWPNLEESGRKMLMNEFGHAYWETQDIHKKEKEIERALQHGVSWSPDHLQQDIMVVIRTCNAGQIKQIEKYIKKHLGGINIKKVLKGSNLEEYNLMRQGAHDYHDIIPPDKTLRAKLEISQTGDAHEQQADAVAQNITDGKDASSILAQPLSPAPSAQAKSEGESLQGTEKLQAQLDSSKGSGQSLPENVQKDIGGKMGADLSDIKIHTGSNAHEMSEGINAKAFTHGQDIYFKNGNYNPESKDGKNLLAHELTHTQQQGKGAQRKVQRKGDPMIAAAAIEGMMSLPFSTTSLALSVKLGLVSEEEAKTILKIYLMKKVLDLRKMANVNPAWLTKVSDILTPSWMPMPSLETMWPIIVNGELGYYTYLLNLDQKQIWQKNKDTGKQEKVDNPDFIKGGYFAVLMNMVENMGSPMMMVGEIAGVFEGIWGWIKGFVVSIWDMIVLLKDALVGMWNLASGATTKKIMDAGQSAVKWLNANKEEVIKFFVHLIKENGPNGLAAKIGKSIKDSIKSAVADMSYSAGASVARKEVAFMNSSAYAMGESIGIAIGYIIPEILLLVCTEGIGNALEKVIAWVGKFAELIKLGRAWEFIMDAGRWALKGLKNIWEIMKAFAQEKFPNIFKAFDEMVAAFEEFMGMKKPKEEPHVPGVNEEHVPGDKEPHEKKPNEKDPNEKEPNEKEPNEKNKAADNAKRIEAIIAAKAELADSNIEGESIPEFKLDMAVLKAMFPIIKRFEYETIPGGEFVYMVSSPRIAIGLKRKSPPNPYGRHGSPDHVNRVLQAENKFVQMGYEHISGGSLPEKMFGNRFPDLVFRNPKTGKFIVVQVGRITKSSLPVAREVRAMADLKNLNLFEHIFFLKY